MSLQNGLHVILTIVVAISTAVAKINPPRLEPDSSTINANPGGGLKLKCIGDYPVTWNITDSPGIDSRKEVRDEEGEAPYVSVLKVVDLRYTDTGFYSCFYIGTTSEKSQENITSIYLYVTDPEHLFVETPQHSPVITLSYTRKNIVPCRVTNPSANVILKSSSGQVNKNDYSYNSRFGILIKTPSVNFNGQFYCVASLNGKTQEVEYTLLFAGAGTPTIQQPFIESENGSVGVMIAGEPFSLKCEVNIGQNKFGPKLNWEYPNRGAPKSRIVEGELELIPKTGRSRYGLVKWLNITRVEKSDEGRYTCTVSKDGVSQVLSDEMYIRVHEYGTHVTLTADFTDGQIVERAAGHNAKFIVHVASNSLTDLYWLKENDRIKNQTNKYVIQRSETRTSLEILDTNITDTANYTCVAKAGNFTDTKTVQLLISAPPDVYIEHNEINMYMYNKTYRITCHAFAFPTAKIRWSWRACKDVLCIGGPFRYLTSLFKPNNETEVVTNPPSSSAFIAASTLNVTAKNPGYYKCEAENSEGTFSRNLLFAITDVDEHKEVKIVPLNVPKKGILESTTVTMDCRASKFNFSSNIYWSFRPQYSLSQQTELQNSTHVLLTRNETEFTYSLRLTLKSIQLNQSGDYHCAAHSRASFSNLGIDKKRIDVLAITAPEVKQTNMNGQEYILDREEEVTFNCTVTGVPTPKITWYRDNQTLTKREFPEYNFLFHDQILEIPRVSQEDEGVYYCRATNLGGELLLNATLSVRPEDDSMSASVKGIVAGAVICLIVLLVISAYVGRKCYLDKKERQEIYKLEKLLFQKGAMESYNPDLPLEDQVDLLPYDRQWEFPREKLKLGKIIGQGAFGRVVKAEAYGILDGEDQTTVAVKMLKEHASVEQRKALMQELKIMIHIGRHVNILNLLGACIQNARRGELLMIIEFCRYGNLRNYLLRHRPSFVNQINPETGEIDCAISEGRSSKFTSSVARSSGASNETGSDGYLVPLSPGTTPGSGSGPTSGSGSYVPREFAQNSAGNSMGDDSSGFGRMSFPFRTESTAKALTTSDLICYAFQIARGMEYLSSRKLVHRDLAARNILLAENNIIKICDFGLAKDCYNKAYYRVKGNGPLPVKWMAIESIRDRVFTTESDVWSLGVVMWEIFSMGSNPYPGLEVDENFYKKLLNGYRMDKPDYATDDLYTIMNSCWEGDPHSRPKFSNLVDVLGNRLDAEVKEHYMDLNKHYLELCKLTTGTPDYLTMDEVTKPESEYMNISKVSDDPSGDYMNNGVAGNAETNYLSMGGSASPVCANARPRDIARADSVEMKPMLSPTNSKDVSFRPKNANPKGQEKNYVVMGDKGKSNNTNSSTNSDVFHPQNMGDAVEV